MLKGKQPVAMDELLALKVVLFGSPLSNKVSHFGWFAPTCFLSTLGPIPLSLPVRPQR